MSIVNIFNRKFYLILAFIFLAELFSLFSFLMPQFGQIAFLVTVILTLILSLIKLEYGIWIILVELFIGSKGYLFALDINGAVISIRIALWLIIMSVWLAKVITNWLKTKQLKIEFLQSRYIYYFIILFIFIVWGLLNGFLNHNSLNNIFFDVNGWLYFSLILPIYSVIKNERSINAILQIFIASIVWLSIKTLFLLYIFSHNFIGMVEELYLWVRQTGVGEITLIQGGFYRVFFQSHIFVLIGFFLFLFLLLKNIIDRKEKKVIIYSLIFTVLFLTITIVNFSRSNWVGLAVGLAVGLFIIIRKLGWKKMMTMIMLLVLAGILSLATIVAIVKFPFPDPVGGFSTAELLSERAGRFQGEAAFSSRWELFPKLKEKMFTAPILGHGFGTTATYLSSDPRILEQSPTGEFTTYAFEWGWLDIWIKLGLLGLLIYIALIFKIVIVGLIKYSFSSEYGIINLSLTIGIIVIIAVSFFSPYLNHPLGIGYLILVSALFDYLERNKLPI